VREKLMETVFTDLEPNHCACCGAPKLAFHFSTERSADGPPVGNERRAVKALTRAARVYLATLRQQADIDFEVVQPALEFEGYEEEPDGECPDHTHWVAMFKVNYGKDYGPTKGTSLEEAEEALESAAHTFALAATSATQIGGRRC
jgi:hypothetical protein